MTKDIATLDYIEEDYKAVSEFSPVETALKIEQIKAQVTLIQRVMQDLMKEGEHYGVIPGTSGKPVLLKAGAEKLAMTFRLAPKYEITRHDLPNNHREYEVVCHLFSIATDKFLGSGVGSCSTLESKYRYRRSQEVSTIKPVPREYWTLRNKDPDRAQQLLGGKEFGVKKINGSWQIIKRGQRKENPDPADYWNVVKKMAKKRAFVDAILTVTAASDIFTQDLEDFQEEKDMTQPASPDDKRMTENEASCS